MADKAYDSRAIRDRIKRKNYKPQITRRKTKTNNRSMKKKYKLIYSRRIIVENFFSWIKKYPKIEKIHEKSLRSYEGLLYLAISMLICGRLK